MPFSRKRSKGLFGGLAERVRGLSDFVDAVIPMLPRSLQRPLRKLTRNVRRSDRRIRRVGKAVEKVSS